MTGKSYFGLILGLILVVCVLLAGCSSQSSKTSTTKITTQPVPKYTAGDIVTNNASTPMYLIISYDSASDLYTRSLVEKNPDGSWNQLTGNSESYPRADLESMYPVLLTQVSVSSVPVATITIITSVPTTLSGSAPAISSISPTTGATGTTVSLTITGSNFLSGATVRLIQAGMQPITATGVSVTATQITCSVNLQGLNAGPANIQVINPDGQSSTLANALTVGLPTPVISSINPTSGNPAQSYTLSLSGTTFTNVQVVTLVSADGLHQITCTSPSATATTVTCTLAIPASATPGLYTVNALTSDGTTGTLTSAFTINNVTATTTTST